MGFGFSKEVPYFPPGTMIKFVAPSQPEKVIWTKITGIVAAYGHRSHEFAVIISLDKPMHPDAVSMFLESYNISEIDGGDEGMCICLSTIIRKYTYAVGDVDPSCASTDAMEKVISNQFQAEMERMNNCVQMTIMAMMHEDADGYDDCECDENSERHHTEDARKMARQAKIECIERAFSTYRQTLLLQMRHQPLGTREWIQMFESYMTFAASEQGLGFIDFVLY